MTESYSPEQVLEKMLEVYGEENLVNPEHYPKVFKHQIFLAKWLLGLPKSEPEPEEEKQTWSL